MEKSVRTPYDEEKVKQLVSEGTAVEAVIRAWTNAGPFPCWHFEAVDDVRRSMPVLAEALDRLVSEQ